MISSTSSRRNHRAAQVFTTVAFVAAISSGAVIQTVAELYRDGWTQALNVVSQSPTAANLRAFETDLEQASLLAGWLRPPTQYARFRLLADGGQKALVGREDWLFYRPGVTSLVAADLMPPPPHPDPLAAIVSFERQLAERGIRLVVVPAPNKESIHPEMLTRRAAGTPVVVCQRTQALLTRLTKAGIEVVDLFEVFRQAKQGRSQSAPVPCYLAQDSHWSPAGMRLAAQAVARRLLERGWAARGGVGYSERPAPVARTGDVLQMLQIPQLERTLPRETCHCVQIVHAADGTPYQDDPQAQVLVLGDSFLRVYQQDEPGGAGFVAHLAYALGQPMASIVSDGGGATLVRQQLATRPKLLQGKKVVVWEFVERDIRDALEGWPIVLLDCATSSEPM